MKKSFQFAGLTSRNAASLLCSLQNKGGKKKYKTTSWEQHKLSMTTEVILCNRYCGRIGSDVGISPVCCPCHISCVMPCCLLPVVESLFPCMSLDLVFFGHGYLCVFSPATFFCKKHFFFLELILIMCLASLASLRLGHPRHVCFFCLECYQVWYYAINKSWVSRL